MRVRMQIVCLVAGALGLIWSAVTVAQPLESDPCRRTCYEEKHVCVQACGGHSNPIECEARCHDDFADCVSDC